MYFWNQTINTRKKTKKILKGIPNTDLNSHITKHEYLRYFQMTILALILSSQIYAFQVLIILLRHVRKIKPNNIIKLLSV